MGSAVAPDMERILGQATVCRKMAEKWIEIAQETQNPALRRCYLEKALRYRTMAAMHEHRCDEHRGNATCRNATRS